MVGKRLSILLVAVVVLCTACDGGDTAGTDTSLPAEPSTASTSSQSATSVETTVSSSTTTTPEVLPAAESDGLVLVMSDDGVYQVELDGAASLLIDGAVAYAIDDTQGGLLFQLERGRVWEESAPNGRSTVIWWVPRGAGTPQELLVPTPGSGHRLTLHDAYATEDGFAVLYTRHEGSIPFDMIDTLRRFEVPGRVVADLFSQGAWEAGFGDVSSNGELIAGTWYQQVGSGCFIDDLDGQPVDLVPPTAGDPTSDDYVEGCRLSASSDRFVFFTQQYEGNQFISTTIDVWDLVADAPAHRFMIPSSNGYVSDIDAAGVQLLANRLDESSLPTVQKPLPGLVLSLDDPNAAWVELPVAGLARFIHTPVAIAAPVEVTAPVSDDPRFASERWIGTVVETRSPDYQIVYLNGEDTGLREGAGGCLGPDCTSQYWQVYAETALGLDGGYPMMIWLTRRSEPSADATDSHLWEVIDAEYVDVPAGYSSPYECWYPNQTQDEWVFGLVHRGQPETAVWAWIVGPATGIISIDVDQVTCLVGDG